MEGSKHPVSPEVESKKPYGVKETKDDDLHKLRIQQALTIFAGNNSTEDSFATPKAARKTFSAESCLSNACSINRSLLHVTRTRGSEKSTVTYNQGNSFTSVGENATGMSPRKRLYFGDLNISDSDFFPSDVARNMLQRDEENNKKENFIMADLDCSSCSNWSVTCRNASITVRLESDNDQIEKKRISISEFIKARTENLGSLSDDPFRQRAYFGSDVLTPFSKADKIFSSTPKKKISASTLLKDLENQYTSAKPTLPLQPIRWNCYRKESLTKKEILEEFSLTLGMQELLIEENSLSNRNIKGQTSIAHNLSLDSQTEETFASSFSSIKSVEATNNSKSSLIELFSIEPEALSIDINSKGTRVSVISNSTQNMKFKTKFDARIINVCPIEGILPAKDQVGLRILVSQFIKNRRENADYQSVVVVTCGKTEKEVHIKVCQVSRPEQTVRDRTYMCF